MNLQVCVGDVRCNHAFFKALDLRFFYRDPAFWAALPFCVWNIFQNSSTFSIVSTVYPVIIAWSGIWTKGNTTYICRKINFYFLWKGKGMKGCWAPTFLRKNSILGTPFHKSSFYTSAIISKSEDLYPLI